MGLVTTAQDQLAAIRTAVGAVLRRQGMRTRSKGTWCRGDDADGWVLVTLRGDKWNTKADAEGSLFVAVWPPGTREHRSELAGVEVEPFVAVNAPLFAAAGTIVGDSSAGDYPVAADMTTVALTEQVSRAEGFAAAALAWADEMLDARVSAPSMRDSDALAALLARHPDWPGIDGTLDRLTAAFQRDARPIELHPVIVRWRRERGLVEVPLPAWSRYASRRVYDSGTVDSPRAELLAGIGTEVEFRFADGTTRLPRAEDLPDAGQIERWREASRVAPLPAGVLHKLPEWLPYASWLDTPATPEIPRPS